MSDYLLPTFMSVLIHLSVVIAVAFTWAPSSTSRVLIRPPAVSATLVVLDAQAPPPAAPKAQPQAIQRAAPPPPPPPVKPKLAVKAAAEPKPPPPKTVAKPPPTVPTAQQLEDERRRAARERLAEQSLDLDLALANESADLQAARAARSASELAESYAARITRAIEQSWTRPPSARNGMRAELLIDLVPTGEVVAVTVVQGSGDAAFDRSAERAVRRLGRLEVPDDAAVFEQYFRRLRLMFQPEDLMR